MPFDLSSTGIPGCWLHAEPALAFNLPNSGGTADWTLALPNDPRIAGASICMQGGVTSPATDVLGLALSNACEIGIGAQ